jgi:lysyl-tRNA synthetase class 2
LSAIDGSKRQDWLPPLAGWLAGIVGMVNIASTLTPDFRSRADLVKGILPELVPVAAHALALSAGLALIVIGVYLAKRRRRAWALGVAILLVAGALNLLKGLDIEEALLSWLLATLLVWGREAFVVQHDDSNWGTIAARLALLFGALAGAVATGVVVALAWTSPALPPSHIPDQVLALLTFSGAPTAYHDPFDWLPAGVGFTTVGVLIVSAYLVFKPLAASRTAPEARVRHAAGLIVSSHGTDSLSFFKLRLDNHYFFDATRRAFVAYRVEGGVLLVSGDPVGPPHLVPGLVRELCAFAEVRGLKIAVVGASRGFADVAADSGLGSFYIGDEAIVCVASFSLEGRPIRKVRQSVTRLERAGYRASLARLGDLDGFAIDELETVSERWLGDTPERGFSMAMDGFRSEHLADSIVVVARDAEGTARGFLHFVPARGGKTMSLSAMRRDPDTPNGLMEFLVVRGIQLLGERRVEELSLNFAAFARLLHSPSGVRDRVLARAMKLGDRYFQVESLYRFNAKFNPRWQERYLLYQKPLGLPRAGLATMWAEGQLPKPFGRAI